MAATRQWRPETIAVAAGRPPGPGAPFNFPPTLASTYRDGGAYTYGRYGNPSWTAFEEAIGLLEGGRALAFSCGQAAAAALLSWLAPGATIVVPTDCYLGTTGLLAELSQLHQYRVRRVDVANTAEVVQAIDGADMVWLESPTNPLLQVADLPAALAAARQKGVTSVVDNTFATPVLQQPLKLGAGAVVHSATKFIGGHSDLLLGVVITEDDQLLDELVKRRTLGGAIPSAMDAFLALRGLRTLPLRVERQQATASVLAERLSSHPGVVKVHYPGLADDPGHARLKAQMSGPGAMISFVVAGAEQADRLTAALQLVVGGTSLGGLETTIDRRSRWEDVPAGLFRLSVGLEHVEDIWADLEAGLASADAPPP